MTDLATHQPTRVQASLDFIANDDKYTTEKPYWVIIKPSKQTPGRQETNIVTEQRDNVEIEDVRPLLDQLSFDHEGFRYIEAETKLGTRFDAEGLREDLEFVTERVRDEVGAEKAICYDIRTRSTVAETNCEMASENRAQPVKPVSIAHTDHSQHGGLRRISRHLTQEEREKYLTGNYHCRIFNVWKPLVEVIHDNPLALCDPRSVDLKDVIAVDRVADGWAGEIYYIRYNPNQQWKCLQQQRRNEMCVFKTFDSVMHDALTFCPHASFMNPLAKPGMPPRQSVEVRVITFNKVKPGTGAVFDAQSHGLYH